METTDFSLSGGTVSSGCSGERLFLLPVYLREDEVDLGLRFALPWVSPSDFRPVDAYLLSSGMCVCVSI